VAEDSIARSDSRCHAGSRRVLTTFLALPAFDPIDAEPAAITNFNGGVGLAYISGMVTQTNVKTGEKLRFPFVDSDMRFMKGEFQGTDRRNASRRFRLHMSGRLFARSGQPDS
jgi:hypothetical protein